MSVHRNGSATSAIITGVAAVDRQLAGPGFELSLHTRDRQTSVGVQGMAAPEQVLRLLAQQGALSKEADRVEVRIETTGGYDHYVYTADLSHRLLFTRAWHRDGLVGLFYGLNPFLADTDGPLDTVPGRNSFRNIVGLLSTQGPVARVDVMNLFTRRTHDARALLADLHDRVADPELERDLLAQADIIIPAWGSKVGHEHDPAVRDLLHVLAELGKVPSLRARHGHILTSGSPPQPTHPRMEGYKSLELVPAPQSWLNGGALPATPRARSEDDDATTQPASAAEFEAPGLRRTAHPFAEAAAAPGNVAAADPTQRSATADDGSPTRAGVTRRHQQSPQVASELRSDLPPEPHLSHANGAPMSSPANVVLENSDISQGLLDSARSGFVAAGGSQLEADAFARELEAQVASDSYGHAALALAALLRHEVGILIDGGANVLPLDDVLHNLGRCGVRPEKAARALVLGAVAVGGCPDGIRPAWQHCQDYGNVTRGDRRADHPVRGVGSPTGARSLYNLLIGKKGAPGSVATSARGSVEHR